MSSYTCSETRRTLQDGTHCKSKTIRPFFVNDQINEIPDKTMIELGTSFGTRAH